MFGWSSIIFLAHGQVYVWGSNSDGQLGLPDTNDTVLRPVLLPFAHQIVHISCGYYHTAFVTGTFYNILSFHTFKYRSCRCLNTQDASDIFHCLVHKLYPGALYLKNSIEVHSTCMNVI